MGNAIACNCSAAYTAVHPHVHGERLSSWGWEQNEAGSSPRTWGTLKRGPEKDNLLRFIPTYMGNASPPLPRSASRLVHPHVHGERRGHSAGRDPGNGSSPRTWGTQNTKTGEGRSIRFIPTYMGNAYDSGRTVASSTVHPHVHGERRVWQGNSYVVRGSSPRTWGTLP